MAKLKLFEYVVLHHEKTEDAGKGVTEVNTKVIVEPTTILEKDDKIASMKIVRTLDESLMDDFENVEIVIRPF